MSTSNAPRAVKIRRLKPKDLPRIAAIEAAAYPEARLAAWQQEDFEYFVSLPSVSCHVATISRDVVGFIMVQRKRNRRTNIDNVAILPEAQRKGIGTRLLKAAVRRARREGQAKVTLEVRATNSGAYQLYGTLGFRKTRVKRGYYEDGESAIIMQLLL